MNARVCSLESRALYSATSKLESLIIMAAQSAFIAHRLFI